ncbi:DEAD/DEAH box helicase [Candidatus Dependentiae bacterium]|nr:DEAD/DEAH box helicase [Candidatus Dependentiae bacterium]
MNKLKFEELNLSKEVLKSISKMGFQNTTPIQAQAIPEIILGRDLIGQASTGTGKTAAFSLPAIEKIDVKNKSVQVLILCPTRELAIQVGVEINKFLKHKKGIKALAVYGGQPINKQIFGLQRGVQIVIGTPGRTMDHIKRGTLQLDQLKLLVLDEADEMLNMGFRPDIEKILKFIPQKRQTVFFSATMSPEILKLTKRYQNNPKIIKVKKDKNIPTDINQIYFDVDVNKKTDALMDLININNPKLAIVFCNTKRKVDQITKILSHTGYRASGIHGDIKQTKRDKIMSKFRSGKINILVATDVAARGIDVPNIDIIFNYQLPEDAEIYVHRIGRTGRAGKAGTALSLISRKELYLLRNIKRYTKIDIIEQQLPNSNKSNISFSPQINIPNYKYLEKRAHQIFGRIKISLDEDELSGYLKIMNKFIDNNSSSSNVAAALLKMIIDFDHKKIQRSKLY